MEYLILDRKNIDAVAFCVLHCPLRLVNPLPPPSCSNHNPCMMNAVGPMSSALADQ